MTLTNPTLKNSWQRVSSPVSDSRTNLIGPEIRRSIAILFLGALYSFCSTVSGLRAQETLVKHPHQKMDRLWGEQAAQFGAKDASAAKLFRDGNYAMFIHWGLYSNLGGKWKGKTYYGIGEWLMNQNMADIPVEEYMETAKSFNPVDFDAEAIVNLAKAAGMKYIVITSKHHEGFAMFDSAHPFNIVDASPFGRDPMKELADACRMANLGFGFYYSHNQDWTAPGGFGGPRQNPDGSHATFDQYFKEKCYPQVKEICTGYGPLSIVWFDTPGGMSKEHVVALRDLVRETQPGALICSRIGHGMGDYVSHGDMEVPPENIDGLWETVDTTNDSWSFAWYDVNWKGPKEILHRLISTVARGGSYMLNVGPNGKGAIPQRCQAFLIKAGEWIHKYPEVIYGAGASPWKHELAWGDVTTADANILHLCITDWPQDGLLHLPGLKTEINSAVLLTNGREVPVEVVRKEAWTTFMLPPNAPDSLISVVRARLETKPEVDPTWGVQPNFETNLEAHFASVVNAEKERVELMEKFGEWKHKTQISKWQADGAATWKVDVLEPGFYQLGLGYRGEDRLVWRIETDEGEMIQNQQAATPKYVEYPMGVIKFNNPGKHSLSVTLVEGNPETSSLASVHLRPIE